VRQNKERNMFMDSGGTCLEGGRKKESFHIQKWKEKEKGKFPKARKRKVTKT